MSKIARRITGLSEPELFESDFRSVNSREDARYPSGIAVRQSIRVAAGMLVGPGDLNKEREQLRSSIPAALRFPAE